MLRHWSQFADAGMRHLAVVGVGFMTVVCLAWPLQAQHGSPQLVPRRALTLGPAPGCDVVPAGQAAAVRRDNAEARRLAAAGQEASLVGDQVAARDAFQRAAQLNPGDERIAYDLARALEELSDSTGAVGEFCRYLTLAPAGQEAADVRGRLQRLVSVEKQRQADNVEAQFRLGLSFFDEGRFESAVKAFDDVVRDAPLSPEGLFNRALARAGEGDRVGALEDLEQYRIASPSVEDRIEVGRAIDVLRRPVYSPGGAFLRSLVPGLGEFHVSHPIRGAFVMAVSGAGAAMAFAQQTKTENISYTDPNGVPAPYTRTTRERTYFLPGIGLAGAMALVGMIDAVTTANRSRVGSGILAPLPVRTTLRPVFTPRTTGLMVAIRF